MHGLVYPGDSLIFAHGLVLLMVWFIRAISVLPMVWFIRAMLFFAHGLVYPGHFLFCEWSGSFHVEGHQLVKSFKSGGTPADTNPYFEKGMDATSLFFVWI